MNGFLQQYGLNIVAVIVVLAFISFAAIFGNTTTGGISDITSDFFAKTGITDGYAVSNTEEFSQALKDGKTTIWLHDGTYTIPAEAKGKTLTINGTKNAIITPMNQGENGADYGFDGSTVNFNGITIDTSKNTGAYPGFARMAAAYGNNVTVNGTYALYSNSQFNGSEFNVSGDKYNLWTWGAPNVSLDGCTFNSDGKAVLLYGGVNTVLKVDNCIFNDKGGLSDLKAAIEIGNDYNKSYSLIVNNTKVNGYEINNKGINTGTTLWANKNSMPTSKLNVVVDGVDVY